MNHCTFCHCDAAACDAQTLGQHRRLTVAADRRHGAVREGRALTRGGRVPRTQALRCRAASDAGGHRDLEPCEGQGDWAVSRHMLTSCAPL